MTVLIITYYWPKSGGSGVQRWLKFVKYFRDFDIEPVVYTVDNPSYEVIDESLIAEIPKGITVLKQPIFEPNNFIRSKKVATAKVSSNPSFIQKMMCYIRGNFFIPDARKFWVQPSVKYLKKYLKNNKIDVVITTGPPHSMHLIGMKLKQQLGVKWIADFRDPMSNLFYNKELLLTKKSKNKLEKLEKQILTTADRILTVSNYIAQEFERKGAKVAVITNGYDNVVIERNQNEVIERSQNAVVEKTSKTRSLSVAEAKFTISHIGLLPAQSNPKILWKVLQELIEKDMQFAKDLQVNLIGNISEKVIESIADFGLKKYIKQTKYVPHSKAIELQKQAQVLLLLIPKVDGAAGIVTGKIFEYITSNRPILAIAPTNGDAAEIITTTKTGVVVDFDDEIKLKDAVLSFYKKYKDGKLEVKPKNITQFHRKNLTEKLAQIITDL
ncbi:MAG: glycosyltransferase family 4 protein [Flavobacteriaceae bacterium]|nr:glycosyltransferase family 4 protein [Flavobacteriaceae bacterium]